MQIKLKTDKNEITTGILRASRSELNAALHKASIYIRKDISDIISSLFSNSETYKSLTSGLLKGDFGIDDADIKLKEILNIIKDDIEVSVTPVQNTGKNLTGGINIKIVKSGFEKILSASGASYDRNGENIPWLNWLLLQGDRIIISTHHVKYDLSNQQKKHSVTGVATMEKGGGWRVPPIFAGTEDDNWITRTLDPNKVKAILDIIVNKRILWSLS